jgi:hypothetical protein
MRIADFGLRNAELKSIRLFPYHWIHLEIKWIAGNFPLTKRRKVTIDNEPI